MLFNSISFVLFGILFFAAWPIARQRRNFRFCYIVAFSLIFYGWANPWHIGVLVLCVSVDFVAGLLMEDRPRHKKAWLFLSLGMNLLALAFYKYAFVMAALPGLSHEFAGIAPVPHALPLGISFFTFQSMTYAIDVYRGQFKPTRSYLHYLAFTTMFPHLLAGPIVRARDLLPQLETVPETSWQDRREGLWRIVLGYFRKMVVADNLAPAVGAAFASGMSVSSSTYWWVIICMFAVQLYCDFSGYSEIARGLAKWMGYDFPVNFNNPFHSTSFHELWSRWHMSLSSWFRDYVFKPLSQLGKKGAWLYGNLILTMTLSGIWHGSGWLFAVWGLWNGTWLALERGTQFTARLEKIPWIGRPLANIVVFSLVFYGLTAFRAESWEQAGFVARQMVVGPTDLLPLEAVDPSALLVLALCLMWHVGSMWFGRRQVRPAIVEWARPAAVGLMIAAIVLVRGTGHSFVYFQF